MIGVGWGLSPHASSFKLKFNVSKPANSTPGNLLKIIPAGLLDTVFWCLPVGTAHACFFVIHGFHRCHHSTAISFCSRVPLNEYFCMLSFLFILLKSCLCFELDLYVQVVKRICCRETFCMPL